jgi:hypothetical protein
VEDRIKKLDHLLITDANLGAALFQELRAAQRELGLLQGDRSTCPFLRPHILSRTQYETEERNGNAIWIYDLAGTSDIRQLTLKGNNQRAIWMPDSRHVTYASDQDGTMSIYTQAIDGSGAPERLTGRKRRATLAGIMVTGWSYAVVRGCSWHRFGRLDVFLRHPYVQVVRR